MGCEGAGDEGPGGFEVGFAVFGEEGCEGGFVGKRSGWVVGWGERIDLVDVIVSYIYLYRSCGMG